MARQLKLAPEMLVPRLGEYLIRRGNLSETDLQKALAYQQEKSAAGTPYLLGQALVELGMIDQGTLDMAVTEQILQLRSMLQEANRTLEKRIEERTAELQAALERLSDLSQLKANFVSNVSHELRTPLTHIKGYIELLISGSLGDVNDEQKHALQVSQRSVLRLESLIEDLILFSLASRGEFTIKAEVIDLRRLVNQTIKGAQPKAEERGVTLHAAMDDNLPPVKADIQKLAWALTQLIDNAIKFTPAGGQVTITLTPIKGNMIEVAVTDTGIGIPAKRINEIFEPFHQLDGSSTRKAGGTGLGLALVRQIVEAHGSIIEVTSTEKQGSTFKFPLLVADKQG